MRFKTKILITLLAIVAFDAIASFLSRAFHVDYTNFIWLSFLLYIAIGFWGAHRKGFVYGMVLGTFAGLVDSTLGWFVSRMVGPFLVRCFVNSWGELKPPMHFKSLDASGESERAKSKVLRAKISRRPVNSDLLGGRTPACLPSKHRDEQNIRLVADFRELWRALLFRFSFVNDGGGGAIAFCR